MKILKVVAQVTVLIGVLMGLAMLAMWLGK